MTARGIALSLILLAACSRAAPGQYRFRWAFWAVTPQGKAEPVGESAVLESGTELGMRLELVEPAFLYLIHHGPGDVIDILLERGGTGAANDAFEPLGSGRRLDASTGLERFHLVVSAQPLPDLEQRAAAYRSVSADRRAEAGRALLAEIQRLRRDHEALETPASVPTRIGGTIRGQEETGAVEFSGTGIFVRTFTVDHR